MVEEKGSRQTESEKEWVRRVVTTENACSGYRETPPLSRLQRREMHSFLMSQYHLFFRVFLEHSLELRQAGLGSKTMVAVVRRGALRWDIKTRRERSETESIAWGGGTEKVKASAVSCR